MSQTKFYRRFGVLICVLVLASLPPLMYGAVSAYLNQQNNIGDWLPHESTAGDDLLWFVERFGSEEVLVVSWPGCTLGNEKLDAFAAELTKPAKSNFVDEPTPLFRHVFTGTQSLAELTAKPTKLGREQAVARMSGWLVGPDGETTCAVALVSKAGAADRGAAIDQVFHAADVVGISQDQIKIGGSTAESVAVDYASQKWMFELGIVASVWGIFAAWLCLRDLRLVAVVFVTTSWAWGLSLSLVPWMGLNLDAILLMMPVLVYVLSISGTVHLTNYYRDAFEDRNAEDALDWAVARGRTPCSFSCVTTAIGLGSLMVSQVLPIQRFGFFAALGVIVVLFSLLVIWPALMHCWARREIKRSPNAASGDGRAWWQPIYKTVSRRYAVIVVLSFVAFPCLAYGTTQIRTSARLEDLLPERSPLIQSYHWLQENIGPLVPVEVVVRFPPRDASDSQELVARLKTVEKIRRTVDDMPNVDGTVAATTFVRPIPDGNSAREAMLRRLIARRVERNMDELHELQYIHDDEKAGEELWRISTRVAAFSDVDYRALIDQMKTDVDAITSNHQTEGKSDIESVVCGGAPLIYMAQEQLLRDLFKSFATAFALIALAMILITRSVGAGLLAMIPNVFPTVAVFGALGALDMSIGMGVMMTASAALGIAVDDTLHFLTWFRRGSRTTTDRKQALLFSFRHCATPMLQTTLICGLGMLVFSLSAFVPIERFAQFMALLLLAALAGDLVVLPSMLISPFGRVFEDRKRRDAKQDEHQLPRDSSAADTASGREFIAGQTT